MSFHRFSVQKSIWNLSVKQLILLESIGCPSNTVWTLKHVLSQQTFEYSRWTWFVQTTFVATDGCATWKVLIRRATFLAGVTQSVRSNLGYFIVTHEAILDLYLNKTLRLFWEWPYYSVLRCVFKPCCRALLLSARFPRATPVCDF